MQARLIHEIECNRVKRGEARRESYYIRAVLDASLQKIFQLKLRILKIEDSNSALKAVNAWLTKLVYISLLANNCIFIVVLCKLL